jgi:hypothetical protein
MLVYKFQIRKFLLIYSQVANPQISHVSQPANYKTANPPYNRENETSLSKNSLLLLQKVGREFVTAEFFFSIKIRIRTF